MNRDKVFIKWEDRINEVDHLPHCPHEHRYKNVPLYECGCKCYEKQIFFLGMQAHDVEFRMERKKEKK